MNLSPITRAGQHYILKTVLLSLLLSAVLFVPVMIYDGGYFLYYGDFNVQEVPFYQMAHDAILLGSVNWSSTTDLGSGFVGSYSFYLLGSPFFWLTIPFPGEFVPYMMGPLFMLKFICAAVAAYIYIKRYVKNKDFAVLGSLLYAFSGFSIYNIFFFHFHEAIIAFPLLLAALDSFMIEKRTAVLALAVFASCIMNYYFFAGQVVFVIIYWIIMVCTGNYKLKIGRVLLLIFEVLLGFVSTAVLLLPSVLGIMGNPRLQQLPNGWSALAYSIPQRYWYIFLSFFFPPEMPAFPNFTKDVECNWASVSGWLPLFSMAGVIGFLQTKSRHWLKKILPILFVMALIPVFNSAFQLFNSSIYYARWFYMITLMTSLATVNALENSRVNWERALGWTAGITVGITLLIGLIPSYEYSKNEPKEITDFKLGVEAYPDRFWVYSAAALVGLLLCALIVKKYKRHTKRLALWLFVGVSIITSVTSSFIIVTGKTYGSNDKSFIIPYALNGGKDIQLDDLNTVRSDFYESLDNLSMYWQIPSMNAFHSVVSTSIMEFYDSIGITRDVASRPDCDYYALRGLFSCKYLFDANDDEETFTIDEKNDSQSDMPGWEYLKTANGCDIYINKYYVPMGFTFDSFITEEDWETLHKYDRHLALTKALVLTSEQMEKYEDITDAQNYDGQKVIQGFSYTYPSYFEDCETLMQNTCSEFEYNNDGFTAVFDNKGSDNLLFFSVPYDEGWSAGINGNPVEIEKVDNGFMAIRVPGNTVSDIKFVYRQPGFHTGIIITTICGIIFAIYLAITVTIRYLKKKKVSFNGGLN